MSLKSPDTEAPGSKTAGTAYHSDGWFLQSGDPMPTGSHILRFEGTWEGTTTFDVSVTVTVS